MKNIIYNMIIVVLFISLNSCSKEFLEQEPSDRPSESTLFSSLEGAQIHLTGIYSLQNYYYGEGTRGILAPDIMGDDALVVSKNNYSRYIGFYRYVFITTSSRPYNFWRYSYRTISNCNLFLEQIEKVVGSETDKANLKAQAYALRAFSYFNLVRWFGETAYTQDPNGRGVIINNTTNELDGYNIGRSTVAEVYDQIVNDLTEAEKGAVSSDYKGEIDASCVAAIQARVYLTMGDWAKAEEYARKAYSGFALMGEGTYLSGFNNVQSEDIWSQKFVDSDVNTFLSLPSFTYTSGNIEHEDTDDDGDIDIDDVKVGPRGENFVFGYNSLRVTRNLIDLYANTDFRKKMFPVNVDDNGDTIYETPGIPSYAQYATGEGYLTTKYQSRGSLGTGDFPRIRASEMYLIEAEAEARQGNTAEAQAALLQIQMRADPTVTSVTASGQALIDLIIMERRKELFFEGQRFFDLKRLDLDLDRTASASDHWSDFSTIDEPNPLIIRRNSITKKFCLPIPQDEIDSNEELTIADQNEFYK